MDAGALIDYSRFSSWAVCNWLRYYYNHCNIIYHQQSSQVLLLYVQAFRIHASLKAATSWAITFFVKEQNTGSALSFSVPTQPEGYVLFLNLIVVVTTSTANINNYNVMVDKPLTLHNIIRVMHAQYI